MSGKLRKSSEKRRDRCTSARRDIRDNAIFTWECRADSSRMKVAECVESYESQGIIFVDYPVDYLFIISLVKIGVWETSIGICARAESTHR